MSKRGSWPGIYAATFVITLLSFLREIVSVVEILVTYDVATETADGRRRLRRVAKVCQAYGQRVQKSVFECVLNPMQLEQFKDRLAGEIDPNSDSLRLYRLREPHSQHLQIMGSQPAHDIRDPLIL